jgi:hypothetical protein
MDAQDNLDAAPAASYSILVNAFKALWVITNPGHACLTDGLELSAINVSRRCYAFRKSCDS